MPATCRQSRCLFKRLGSRRASPLLRDSALQALITGMARSYTSRATSTCRSGLMPHTLRHTLASQGC
jgi:hypothetical protein